MAAIHAIATSDRRLPPPERLFLLVVLLVSGTVTLPQVLEVGFMTGLGLWTTVIACIAWGLWFLKPAAPRGMRGVLLPLAAFTGFGLCTPIWGLRDGGTTWVQLLIVLIAFNGFVVLTARECAANPLFGESLLRTLDFASITAAIFYTLTVLLFGPGGDAEVGGRPLFMARPFALFAIIAVSRQLARWQAGERVGFFLALWLTGLVILSQSRLGMVTILALYPLSCFLVGGKAKVKLGAIMLVLGTGLLAAMLMFSQTMYDRFFAFDASLSVGGVSINSMGRTAAWTALLNDIRVHGGLFFGHGSGAASNFCVLNLQNLPHPHNDYIRFLYDFGIFGLGWFLIFVATALVALWVRLRQAVRNESQLGISLTLTGLQSLLGVLISMLTDNSGNYIFVMAPLGILIGAALASSEKKTSHAENLDWVFETAEPYLPAAASPLGRADNPAPLY